MINNRRVLAIIPARGGSKRLPRKNILPLCGKPLIAWTIDAAKASSYIDQVVVSTDDEEIAKVAVDFGAETPFKRSIALSSDVASTEDVILDCLDKIDFPDDGIVVILQPTSPLRSSDDIDRALLTLSSKDIGGVVSVTICEHPPYWCNTLPQDNNMETFIDDEYKGKRSQDLPLMYRLNGAVYVFTASKLRDDGIDMTNNVYAIVMPNNRSIDIDSILDFKFAELLLDLT